MNKKMMLLAAALVTFAGGWSLADDATIGQAIENHGDRMQAQGAQRETHGDVAAGRATTLDASGHPVAGAVEGVHATNMKRQGKRRQRRGIRHVAVGEAVKAQ